jgi:hypothetical protein
MLFHFDPLTSDHSTVHISEIFVIIFVTCMLIEEIRNVRFIFSRQQLR